MKARAGAEFCLRASKFLASLPYLVKLQTGQGIESRKTP